MKTTAILLTSLLIAFITGCQDHPLGPLPEDLMAWRAGGPENDSGQSIATDKSGNIYVAGNFLGTITLGSIALTSNGAEDIFIAKYNSSGDILWARKIGGTSAETNVEIAVEDNGNLYVTGDFTGTASFGSTVLTSNGAQDIFLAKYNTNGELHWAQRVGGTGGDTSRGIAVDKSGAVFITGNFANTVNFGSEVLSASGLADAFLAKYNTNGNIQWVRGIGGPGLDFGSDVSVDDNSNVYVTGTFNGTINFGATTLTSDNAPDLFIAKYNTNGEVQWAQQTSGSGQIGGNKIATDASGNVYVAGYIAFSAISNSVMFGTTELKTVGDLDIFLAKYNANGVLQWAQRAGGASYDYNSGIAIDKSGDVYLTGVFEGSAMYGSIMLTSSGSSDIYIAKFNSNGTLLWAQSAGGTNSDTGRSIKVANNGTIYITGGFQGTATFGTTTLTASGDTDIFVAKFKQ